MTVQTEKLQRMFDSDSSIMLETLSGILGNVGTGQLSADDVERAFRAAHSIKSEAGFLNLVDIAESAHRLEDELSGVRDAGGAVDEARGDGLRRGVRALGIALKEHRAQREARRSSAGGDASDGAQHGRPTDVDGARAGGAGADRTHDDARATAAERGMLREARLRGEHLFRVTVQLRSDRETRYARSFLVVNNLEVSCAVVRTEPSLESVKEDPPDKLVLLVTTSGEEEIIRRAVHVDEVELEALEELSYEEAMPGTSVVERATSERREPPDGSPVSARGDRHEEVAVYAEEIVAAARELRDLENQESGDVAERARKIVRFATVLRDRIGSSNRVQILDLLRELKTSSVRYAARQGKRVRMAVGGHGALVEGAVGDTVLEALMHLIRNSIDHGIETIEDRAGRGRHPAATIKLRVDRIGGRVRIVVQDDGRGIDEQAVRARAGDESSSLLDVLARSGFSMRDEPDTGSGRGVGLDVVMHSVRTLLGGEIKLINRPGAGMTFIISVPESARLIHVLVVVSGESAYMVPSATVVSHHIVDRTRIKRDSFGALYYEYEGEALPLSTPAGRSPVVRTIPEGAVVVVVNAGRERRAIVVDAVRAEEAVVRDDARIRRVYSRTLGREAQFLFPAALATNGDERE
ncbi:MAG: ATP-binding protein [Spirochaetota bacterium]